MVLTIYRMTGHFITTTLPQGWAVPFHLPKDQSKTPKLLFSSFFFFLNTRHLKGELKVRRVIKGGGTPVHTAYHKPTILENYYLKGLFPSDPSPYTCVCKCARRHARACTYIYIYTHTHFPLCQGTAARQILTNTNGFWLLLGNPSILTWEDVLSQIQTLELSHQLFMWHRWRVAIRS